MTCMLRENPILMFNFGLFTPKSWTAERFPQLAGVLRRFVEKHLGLGVRVQAEPRDRPSCKVVLHAAPLPNEPRIRRTFVYAAVLPQTTKTAAAPA